MLNERIFGIIEKGYKIKPADYMSIVYPTLVLDWRAFGGANEGIVAGYASPNIVQDVSGKFVTGLLDTNLIDANANPDIPLGVLVAKVGERYGNAVFAPYFYRDDGSTYTVGYKGLDGNDVLLTTGASGEPWVNKTLRILGATGDNMYVLINDVPNGILPASMAPMAFQDEGVVNVQVVKFYPGLLLSLPNEPAAGNGLVEIVEATPGNIIDTGAKTYKLDSVKWSIRDVARDSTYTTGYLKFFISDDGDGYTVTGASVFYNAVVVGNK